MKKVVCFGEALIDFLNTGTLDDGGLALNCFTEFPGGAPANAAVAVAKLGGTSVFMGQVGNDPFGDFLIDALDFYGVNTTHTFQHPNAPTALAYVFLDEDGERTFSFRRDSTADLLFSKKQVDRQMLTSNNILHYCSNTLTESGIADVTKHVVSMAKKQGAFISFDVNLRHNLWAGGEANRDLVNELVGQSELVKFEKSELIFLAQGHVEKYLNRCFKENVKAVLITDGPNPISFVTAQGSELVKPPEVKVLDTTGGGDAFIGGVLFRLSESDSPSDLIQNVSLFEESIKFAALCGAHTVSRQGAFPAFPSLEQVKHKSDS